MRLAEQEVLQRKSNNKNSLSLASIQGDSSKAKGKKGAHSGK
jgi:hypothetical protein